MVLRHHHILDAMNNTLHDKLEDDSSLQAKYRGISESTQGHTLKINLERINVMAAPWGKVIHQHLG